LILLGDVLGVPVGKLFIAALVPSMLLIFLYGCHVGLLSWRHPDRAPPIAGGSGQALGLRVISSLLPPLLLIVAVLGSIFFGIASPTESAAVGSVGALLLAAWHRRLTIDRLRAAVQQTARLTSMVFLILIGATAFGLVFRGMGGDSLVHELMTDLPGGSWGFLIVSMLLIFVLGFFLDFLEICFIVVPIIGPIAAHLGFDMLWFAILIAVNLQTSFLTPPFGFSLFYLKSVSPPQVTIEQIYRGILPFVLLQLLALAALVLLPDLVLWLPNWMERFH
jgi:tripartite ATP-independent transporter DctM subunit